LEQYHTAFKQIKGETAIIAHKKVLQVAGLYNMIVVP
jgi:hypothetical protein